MGKDYGPAPVWVEKPIETVVFSLVLSLLIGVGVEIAVRIVALAAYAATGAP